MDVPDLNTQPLQPQAVPDLGSLVHGLVAEVQQLRAQLAQQQQQQQQYSAGFRAADTYIPRSLSMKLGKPPRFGGKPSEANAWIRTMRTFLFLQQTPLDNDTCVIWASTFLEASAAQWYQALVAQAHEDPSAGFTCWSEFEQAFKNQFEERFPADRARDRLAYIRQRTSVAAYVSEFTSLLVHLPFREEGDNIHSFMRGLKPHLAEKVAMAMPSTLQEAINLALKVDGAAMHVARMLRTVSPSTVHYEGPTPMDCGNITLEEEVSKDVDLTAVNTVTARRYSTATPASNSAPLKPLTPEERQRLIRENKCFRCRQPGHIARECPIQKGVPKN